MIVHPEPPNGSIVGWGAFANQVRVRVDAWAHGGSDCHWFPADDNTDQDPTDWASLDKRMSSYGDPYLLVRQDFPSALAGPATG